MTIEEQLASYEKRAQGKTPGQIVKTIAGKCIGFGAYRTVYNIKGCPDLVMKIERTMERNGAFTNVMEWNAYTDARHTPIQKGLCPAYSISKCGQVLIMHKAQPMKKDPNEIPNVFTDTKRANWGMIGRRYVCVDYPFMVHPMFRMKKPRFFDD